MQKIVIIGGGSGVAELLTEFRKIREVHVSAIISVFDSGGSTGRLRAKLKIPAVGDLRNCFSAVAKNREISENLEARLQNGHAIGNLVFAFFAKKFGFKKATEIYNEFIDSNNQILPVSFDNATLVGQITSGDEIYGEEKFDRFSEKSFREKIEKIRLVPRARLNTEVLKIFATADKIIVGPGSLFGSLLVNFVVKDFSSVFQSSRAQKILIINATREFGCEDENSTEIAARFPVKFDKILRPAQNLQRWNMKTLVKKILT